MRHFSASPVEMIESFWRNRQLVFQMSKREVIGRYRGSVIGLAWSFFNPLLMLLIYTFVFSVVFKTRWNIPLANDNAGFAIVLFAGLLVFGLFSECVTRASTLITMNVSYVKKVVFPLEILPFVAFGSALFHSTISLIVLLLVQVVLGHYVPVTALLFPIVLLPVALGTLGAAWFLSALGAYLRDVGQLVTMLLAVLPFVSAVFFPISSLPPRYQSLLRLNPLAVVIEEGRKVLIFGELPDFNAILTMFAIGLVIACAGFAWFQKMRRGFADVL